jgi:hypothetical protein
VSETYFHGTREDFSRGGWLTPRAFHAGAPTDAPLNPGRQAREDSVDYIYFTRSLVLAWAYALEAPGTGKPKVLLIEPQDEVEFDPEHSLDMVAYRSPGWARVLDVLTRLPHGYTAKTLREGWEVRT